MNGFAEIDEPDREVAGSDLRVLFMRGVARSFPWVVLLILLGAAIGAGVGLLQPNRYVSNAKLILRMGAREQLTSESLVDIEDRQHAPPPTMVDELQMLSDVAIFERVARELGASFVLQAPDPRSQDRPSTSAPIRLMHGVQAFLFRRGSTIGPRAHEDELLLATKALRENTIVVNEPGSNVILVSHSSTSPALAQTIVEALTNAFIERHREQFSILALLEKNRGKLEEAKRVRDRAASAYVEHVSASGISQLEMQVPRLETELGLLESELFEARVRREEIGQLCASLSDRLQGIPSEVEIQRPSVMIPNEEYETYLTLKRQLLGQKQEMLINNRPSEETRRREGEFDRRIAEIGDKLRILPQVIPQGAEMQENLGHSAMEARIAELEVEDEALVVKVQLLQSRLDGKKAGVGELQKQLLTATILEQDLSSVREAEESRYTHMLDRFSVLEALEGIDVSEDANLRVLQAPTLELEKVEPQRAGLLLKGLLAGMFAATVFAVLRERFAHRLHYPEVFEQARDVPVLAVVPHLSSLRGLKNGAIARSR